jgi:catechol 2,3-dioxygenase-like lactoylglutathione lyase family enzyme
MPDHHHVTEMRLAVTAPDYQDALTFYRDVLGMAEIASYEAHGGHVTILDAGRATLELSDPAHAAYIDEVEVGSRVAPHLRIAFEVADSAEATRDAVAAGAGLIHEPVQTPWGSVNSRLAGPAGLQLTLFSNAQGEQWEE